MSVDEIGLKTAKYNEQYSHLRHIGCSLPDACFKQLMFAATSTIDECTVVN